MTAMMSWRQPWNRNCSLMCAEPAASSTSCRRKQYLVHRCGFCTRSMRTTLDKLQTSKQNSSCAFRLHQHESHQGTSMYELYMHAFGMRAVTPSIKNAMYVSVFHIMNASDPCTFRLTATRTYTIAQKACPAAAAAAAASASAAAVSVYV